MQVPLQVAVHTLPAAQSIAHVAPSAQVVAHVSPHVITQLLFDAHVGAHGSEPHAKEQDWPTPHAQLGSHDTATAVRSALASELLPPSVAPGPGSTGTPVPMSNPYVHAPMPAATARTVASLGCTSRRAC